MHICVSPLFSCHIGSAIRPRERVFFIMWLEIVFSPHPCPSPKKEGSA